MKYLHENICGENVSKILALFLMIICLPFLCFLSIIFIVNGIWAEELEYSRRKCFICGEKDRYLKQSSEIFDPEYLDFENTYVHFWYHDLCIKKGINHNNYIIKTLESIERGYLVDGWPEEAIKIGLSINRREWRRPYEKHNHSAGQRRFAETSRKELEKDRE